MQEIKFRVWDKKLKTYLNPEYFYITGEGRGFTCEHLPGMYSDRWVYMGTARFILMQYTGLKDKNGKEIYEGDILAYTWYEDKGQYGITHKQRMTITFINGSFSLGILASDSYQYSKKDWEITGNRHENPKLLK